MGEIIQLAPTMLTIPEVAKRTNLSQYYLRKLCINNQISHLRTGKKYLINYEKFLKYINNEI